MHEIRRTRTVDGTRSVPIVEQILSSVRAFAAGSEYELDHDHPRIDAVIETRRKTIATLAGDAGPNEWMSRVRTDASSIHYVETAADGSVRHRLRRDLFLIPLTGYTRDVEMLVCDVDRMSEVSEILRRGASGSPLEDVVLLPVVLDKTSMAAPRIAAIRSTIAAVSACLDSVDPWDDRRMADMAAAVAARLGGRMATTANLSAPAHVARMHAVVGVASSRLVDGDDGRSGPDPDRWSDDVFQALAYREGDNVLAGRPAAWPRAAATVAAMALRMSLRTIFFRERMALDPHISTLRCGTSRNGADLVFSAVVGQRVVGVVSIPASLARQDKDVFWEELKGIADKIETRAPERMMDQEFPNALYVAGGPPKPVFGAEKRKSGLLAGSRGVGSR